MVDGLDFFYFFHIGQESDSSLSLTYACMRHYIFEKWGMDIDVAIAKLNYDGLVDPSNFFKKKFPDQSVVQGHICLQHSRSRSADKFVGGWRKLIKNYLDTFAWFPNPLLSVSADVLISKLESNAMQAKGLRSLLDGNGIGGFHAEDGQWRAVFSSSFTHVPSGYTTYVNQGVEAHWKSKNLEEGKFTKDNFEKIFEKAETGYLKKILENH